MELALSGGVPAEDVRRVVTRYFSVLKPGTRAQQLTRLPLELVSDKVVSREGSGKSAQVRMTWLSGAATDQEASELAMIRRILTSRDNPLLKAINRKGRIATGVHIFHSEYQLANTFSLRVNGETGVSAKKLETGIRSALRQLAQKGFRESDVRRARNQLRGELIEAIDGNSGRVTNFLTWGIKLGRDSSYYRSRVVMQMDSTPASLSARLEALSRQPVHVELTDIASGFEALGASADLGQAPAIPLAKDMLAPTVPDYSRTKLANGVEVFILPRKSGILTQVYLEFPGSDTRFVTEAPGASPTLASILRDRLGTVVADFPGAKALVIQRDDYTSVRVKATPQDLRAVMKGLVAALENHDYDASVRNRATGVRTDGMKQGPGHQKMILFGRDHPLAIPQNGDLELSGARLAELHARLFSEKGLKIIVENSTGQDELLGILNKTIGGYRSPSGKAGQVVEGVSAQPVAPDRPAVILFDVPGAMQADIRLTRIARFSNDREKRAFDMVNRIFGRGAGRLVQNLRISKGWTYGLYTDVNDMAGVTVWQTRGTVQTDKAAASMAEIRREMEIFQPLPAEFEDMREQDLMQIIISARVFSRQSTFVRKTAKTGLSDDRLYRDFEDLQAMTLDDLRAAAANHLTLDDAVWIITGDLARIEDDIRGLDLGAVEVWDSMGNKIR